MSDKLPILTSCRDCVFAEYVGDTQEDCYLGRITKFEEVGAQVVGCDDGVKQYLTVNRFCNTVRRPETVPDLPIDQIAEKVREDVTAKVAAIVYVGCDTFVVDVFLSLRSIQGQEVKPVKLIVLLDNAVISPPAVISMIRELEIPCPWEVVRVEDADEAGVAAYPGGSFDRSVDIAVNKLDHRRMTYYTAGRAGYQWPSDYIRRIDVAINYNLIPLVAVIPDDGQVDGYAVQTKLHRHAIVCGNIGGNILGKLPALKEDYGDDWAILSYQEIAA